MKKYYWCSNYKIFRYVDSYKKINVGWEPTDTIINELIDLFKEKFVQFCHHLQGQDTDMDCNRYKHNSSNHLKPRYNISLSLATTHYYHELDFEVQLELLYQFI